MKSFSKLYYDFWTNYDNSKVTGTGLEGQLLALYLQSNAHCNALGVYYLPLSYISNDLRLPAEKIQASLDKLSKINYCKYDTKTQHIWVCNLAFEQVCETTNDNDDRVKSLQTLWKSLPLAFEFLEEIYQKYHTVFYFDRRFPEKPPKVYETKAEAALAKAKRCYRCIRVLTGALPRLPRDNK